MGNNLSGKTRIIVVGGGAGGLELVTRLGRKLGRRDKAEVILVDDTLTHIWKPLLHEVATGALDQSLDEISYVPHAKANGYTFHTGTLIGLDRIERNIHLAPVFDAQGEQLLAARSLTYDYLVLAIGSVSNDFGIPGVAEHCYFLDSSNQAGMLHKALLDSFLRHGGDHGTPARELSVAIVGAGATGVELAAELISATEILSAYGYSQVGRERLQIHLIEAEARVLPALPERISQTVIERLERLGITVHIETIVAQVDAQGLQASTGKRIDADLCIWAAGVCCNSMLSELGLNTRPNHQILVDSNLASVDDKRIFAIGDCAAFPMGADDWVPPRAQAAHQMASLAFHNVRASFANKPLKVFKYKDFGSLVSLARFTAVGTLMSGRSGGSGLLIEGTLAKLCYVSLYRMHQRVLHGSFKTLLKILVDGINIMLQPRLKLH